MTDNNPEVLARELERWPGYNEQSWSERFAELNRRYGKLLDEHVALAESAALRPSPIRDAVADGMPAETAPIACHVLAGRFDNDCGEWIYSVAATPLSRPFTHWWPLPDMAASLRVGDAVADAEGVEDDTKAFCDQWERPFQSGEPSRAGVARDVDAPKELFGAVGMALFRADCAGMNAPDSIAEIGNAAWTFLRTANTGRAEEIERAWKQGFCRGEASNFGCFPPTVAQVDEAWRKSKTFEALSSPPVTTAPDEGIAPAGEDAREEGK